MKSTVHIHIMENDFQLACEPSERANIEASARYLNDHLRAFRADNPQVSFEQLMIMGALRVTCELFASNDAMRNDIRETNAQLERLLKKVTLPEPSETE